MEDQLQHEQGTNLPDVQLRIVFVHGVHSGDSRQNADRDLVDLERTVIERVNGKTDSAGRKVRLTTTRVNLYTGDDDVLLSPPIDDLDDDSGNLTANAWRSQLVKKTTKAFGDHGNIVFVGHSTGARVAAEVASDPVLGFRERTAGVVTINGMIDALGSDAYDFIGPIGYESGCRFAQGKGWCAYSAKISAVPALDWVARERHALSLIAWGDCSPSVWTGENDKSLPLRAQGSPWVPGLSMTPADGKTFAPAHGVLYGKFCHSDITSSGSPRHGEAVDSAGSKIASWLFEAAPRVMPTNSPDSPTSIAALESNTFSRPISAPGPCPPGRRDHGQPDVAGVCVHPGFFDGDDHPFDGRDLIESTDGVCGGSVRFSHLHEGDRHGARIWLKTYSIPEGGGLLGTLR